MVMPWESSNLFVIILFGVVALGLLVVSADEVVKRLIRLAEYFNLSTTFMGMTVVSVATSIPEISSHLIASVNILADKIDYRVGSSIVLGANIGSNVVQQTLILGIVVLLAGGLYFRRYFLWKSMLPMIVTHVLCIILGISGMYSRIDGMILLVSFLAYNYFLYWDERRFYKKEPEQAATPDAPGTCQAALKDALLALAAMSITVISAQIVLSISERVVEITRVGGSLVGVITLGVASALPELMTALAGVKNKDQGISLGTLVGSNITNPLLGVGLGALISTYWVPAPLLQWDLPWEILTGAILWGILWFTKGKIGRSGSYILMGMYFFYIIARVLFFAVD
ncbi:MAG: sodium:calcium antiporter [Chloroflexi bacterium]|nr:sodium:calcium antiporter [Chloroflexota bacterium]